MTITRLFLARELDNFVIELDAGIFASRNRENSDIRKFGHFCMNFPDWVFGSSGLKAIPAIICRDIWKTG